METKTMMSNRQKAQDNYVNCKRLIKASLAEGTLSFSAEGKVIRSEIYEAIKVSRSVMNQNPKIKRLLEATERLAKRKGVVSSASPLKITGAGRASGKSDPSMVHLQAQLSFLERRVAALTVENRELRKTVKRAEWLDKFLNDSDGRQGAFPW